MFERPLWHQKILAAWKKRPIVWLSGVRRVGKTTLSRMFEGAEYLNCDLPSTARRLAEPEFFFDSLTKGSLVILDEVHRLEDPSLILKIAADAYPHLKVLATGSPTLSATKKFRDSLTGRKETLYLPPVLWTEARDTFGITDGDRRLLHGGLPEPLLSEKPDPAFYAEWMDSFYARDVQELFRIRSRTGFLKLLHLLLSQSGGQLDYLKLSREIELSRPTIKSHIDAMQLAHAVYLLPPFSGGGRKEILKQPKCYGFDTGFVCFAKGWDSLRSENKGLLWEHCVLDILRTVYPGKGLYYWREKSGHELDFIVKHSANDIAVYECKYNPEAFDAAPLAAFRALYPKGTNYVLSPVIKEAYRRTMRGMEVRFIPADAIMA
jgi:uncharacterized protein